MRIHFANLASQCALIHPCCSEKADTKHKPILYLSKFFLIGGSLNPLFGWKKV